ncbi:MAG: hypothetical protein IJ352_06665 [Muribaculaceae bacterium]|nr:hypothetical protein [Muribaculaceae bacterium]
MELEFKQLGSRWVAEMEVTSDFNLHVERVKSGSLSIFQKGVADGLYASESSWSDAAESVVNKDFSMLVYPKWIRIESGSEVTRCVVAISGGGR